MSHRTKWVFEDPAKKAEWASVLKEMFKAVKTGTSNDLLFYVKFKSETVKRKVYAGCYHGRHHYTTQQYEQSAPQTGVYYSRPVLYRTKYPRYVKNLFLEYPGYRHIIVLKLNAKWGLEEDIPWLIAHEYRHYIQKIQGEMKKHARVEVDANAWADGRLKVLAERGYIRESEWVGPNSNYAKKVSA